MNESEENRCEEPKIKVFTIYGHGKTIDSIMLNTFYGDENKENYRNAINNLELNDGAWVRVQEIEENIQYSVDKLLPPSFDIITLLDDSAIQTLLRRLDSRELALAMKGESDTVKEKIFSNMSKRAAAMLKEDMYYMRKVPKKAIKETQEKIVDLVNRLAGVGEIFINYSKGETVE